MGTRFQPRADTGANWTSADPVLLLNEFGYDTTAKQFKMGDGVSAWSLLPYATLNSGVPVTWTAAQTFDSTINQAPGQGANNSSPFAQYGDMWTDARLSGLTTTTSATLSGTLTAGVAYVIGQRVPYAGSTYTVAASSTSYLDLSNTGALTVTTTSGTVTANSLRLWSVTSSATAITAVTQIAINGLSTSGSPIGIYSQGHGLFYGISQTLPPPPGWTTVGGYYNGMGISGSTAGTGSPIFGVLNSSQIHAGAGSVAFTIYDTNKIQTFNSTLDDGAGNMTVAGTVLSRLSVSSTITVGDITLTAAQLAAGYFSDGATQTAAFTVTTDTAANILAAMPNAVVGTAFKLRFINHDQSATGYAATLVGGVGVTIGTTLPNPAVSKGTWADYLFIFTSIGTSVALTAIYVGQGTI